MNIDEAMKILNYKINVHKEDVFIGDLDKTNIEAIQVVLKEIERLNNIINKAIEYIKEKARNNCWIDQYEASDLIKILKGVNKE